VIIQFVFGDISGLRAFFGYTIEKKRN